MARTSASNPNGGRRRLRRAEGDRGAVLVEFALVLPIIALFTFGVIDFGLAWRVDTVVERASAAGGRSGSSLGDNRYADYQLLQVVNSSLSSVPGADIERVIVYRSTAADGEVPASCLAVNATGTSSKGVNGLCNVYSAAQVSSTSFSGWGGVTACAGGSWDSSWCPTSRSNDRPGADYLGVYVEVSKDAATGLFTDEFTMKRSSVFLLEPESVGDDN
jgi:Flp pilus assembly protein TadG